MHDSGFLADDQRALVSAERNQDGRLAEIEIWTIRLGAVRTLWDSAPNVERILLGELARPKKLTRFETQRQDGIARRARWIGIVIARGHVQSAELLINGRRRPDAGAGRPVLWGTRSRFAYGFGRVRDCESLPELLSSRCIQRHHAA